MSRLPAVLLSLLVLAAHAQSSAPEPAPEPTNTLGVIAFLVLFIGSIVGFVAYVWWQGRHRKATEE